MQIEQLEGGHGPADQIKWQQELAACNEHLERMLIQLDGITGLEGEHRHYKKSKIDAVSALCAKVDALKNR
jgi:BAG domain